ncbi:MAG: glutathione S-transferase [Rhodospirillales bacterium]
MKLYYRPGACSMAVHVLLEDLGLDYEAIAVSDEVLASEDYKKTNPRNQVPSLATDDGLLTESVAIMLYLSDKFGGNLTPPRGTWEHGQMMMMLMFMASQEHPAFAINMRPFRWTDDESAHAGIKAKAEQNWIACLTRTNGWAEGREWLVGDKMTLADSLAWVHARWGLRCTPKTPDGFPALWALANRVDAHPAAQRVMEQEGIKPLL